MAAQEPNLCRGYQPLMSRYAPVKGREGAARPSAKTRLAYVMLGNENSKGDTNEK